MSPRSGVLEFLLKRKWRWSRGPRLGEEGRHGYESHSILRDANCKGADNAGTRCSTSLVSTFASNVYFTLDGPVSVPTKSSLKEGEKPLNEEDREYSAKMYLVARNNRRPLLFGSLRRELFGNVNNHQLTLNRHMCDKCAPVKPSGGCGYGIPFTEECAIMEHLKQPRVAIVGAGLAGLSAAARLQQCGITNYSIYEATSRIGGRVNTSKLGKDGMADLGAEWLSGGNMANPVYVLACREGLVAPDSDTQGNVQPLFLTSEGGVICFTEATLAYRLYTRVRDDAVRLFSLGLDKGHGALSYFISSRLEEEVAHVPETYKDRVRRVLHAFVNNIRTRWGTDLLKMSSDLYGSYQEVPGSSVRLKKGMVNTLLPLLREIPEEKIHCYTPVQQINWKTAGARISLKFASGREEKVDYVIVTVPLGFLKANHRDFFLPSLPENKIEAIENMGFGQLTKVFMKYKAALWGPNRTSISTVWKVKDWGERGSFWYKGISTVDAKNDMVGVTVAGCESVIAEEGSIDNVVMDLTNTLRNFTGARYLPMPEDAVKSSWNTDPYYLGAVSYMSTSSCLMDPLNLAEPVPFKEGCAPKLLFAGEATSPSGFSSMHGARLSGIREADRVLQLTSKYCGPPPS